MPSSGALRPVSPTTSTPGLAEVPGPGPWGGSFVGPGRRGLAGLAPGWAWAAWSPPGGREAALSLLCAVAVPSRSLTPGRVLWAVTVGVRGPAIGLGPRRRGQWRQGGGGVTEASLRWEVAQGAAPGHPVRLCPPPRALPAREKSCTQGAAPVAFSLPASGGSLCPPGEGVLPPAGRVLDAEWLWARTSGAGEEPQAATCAVRVQFPSELSGTASCCR